MLTAKQAIKLAPRISELLFAGKKVLKSQTGRAFPVKTWVGVCVGVDIEGIRFITQNPYKDTPYARKAQGGAQILWVIELSTNKWIAKIENGVVRPLLFGLVV